MVKFWIYFRSAKIRFMCHENNLRKFWKLQKRKVLLFYLTVTKGQTLWRSRCCDDNILTVDDVAWKYFLCATHKIFSDIKSHKNSLYNRKRDISSSDDKKDNLDKTHKICINLDLSLSLIASTARLKIHQKLLWWHRGRKVENAFTELVQMIWFGSIRRNSSLSNSEI